MRQKSEIKVLTVIGARPQFVKAAAVSRWIKNSNDAGLSRQVNEMILHTGQHYDPAMSEVFFTELAIPRPVANLGVGSGLHGAVTGAMLGGIEGEIIQRRPDYVMVYGDTNSTLAAALAAAKLHVPVIHVEAGLRSFNRRMPEEINRVLTDHISSLLFCPTLNSVQNLAREGIEAGVWQVGDVMYDACKMFSGAADDRNHLLERLGLRRKKFHLLTLHRAENTDDPVRLRDIMGGIQSLAEHQPVVFPVHPRTNKALLNFGWNGAGKGLQIIAPLSFLDMLHLEASAACIITDSGGIQKEAYFHGVPCVTLRDETEWVETVTSGWNVLVGSDANRLLTAVRDSAPGRNIPDYGDGEAGRRIVETIIEHAA